jgi:PAS domain S-box-containing protein
MTVQGFEPIADRSEGIAEAFAALANVRQPLAVVDLAAERIVAANAEAAELFNASPSELVGRSLLEVIVPEGRDDAKRAQELLRSGQIDGFQAHRIYNSVHGPAFEADVWVRKLAIPDVESVALVVIVPDGMHQGDYSSTAVTRHHVRTLIAVTDHDWSIRHASAEAKSVLGVSPRDIIGTPFPALVHPDDMPSVLFAITDAITSKRTAVLKARLGTSNRRWRDTTYSVTALCDHSPPRLCILATLSLRRTQAAPGRSEAGRVARTEQLEQTLWRIAVEVRAATSAPQVCDLLDDSTAEKMQQLSSRQWEIVSRLSRGEPPSKIAANLYVSPSTVRNQLSAIYRKLGVHSQLELLALFRTVAPSAHLDDAQ